MTVQSPSRADQHTGRSRSWWRSRGTLGEMLSGRANGFGLVRLLLALAVVVSHSKPIGYGRTDVGNRLFGQQSDLGSLAVVGFFVVSGFMITASGGRLSVGRFAWHRALRILPALWVSVAVTAFVAAPVIYFRQHGTLDGLWSSPTGPFSYVTGMWNASAANGWDIAGIMKTGIALHTNYNGSFDGAVWSLPYEMSCYVVVAILAAGGVLTRARRTVPLIAAALWVTIVMNLIDAPGWRGAPSEHTTSWHLPLLGWLISHYVIYLGFVFLVGATLQLYKDRIPVNDLLAAACLVAVVASLLLGGFFVVGYPALCYLVIWAGLVMPRQLHWVGRGNDYSYGIYIYGFLVEQILVIFGVTRYGYPVYLGAAVAFSWVLAWFSWHLVENPALRLKNWTPAVGRRLRNRAVAVGALQAGPAWFPNPGHEEVTRR